MTANELRKMSAEDLQVKVEDLRKAEFEARQKVAARMEANTAQIRSLRKDIARALLVLAEKRRQLVHATGE
jgi:large subunit ribosomal protein L29